MALIEIPSIGHVDDQDKALVRGDGRSLYRLKHAEKSPGRLAAEGWAALVLRLFREPEFNPLAWREWRHAPYADTHKTNGKKLDELRDRWPDLAEPIDAAIEEIHLRS